MDMGFALFYYTLFILLAVILTAAACLASYLVSRTKALLFAFFGFFFYFFDVALVFQDDFLMQRAASAATPFFIGSPLAALVIGGGTLVSFWLVVCEYLEERRMVARWAPGAAYAVASLAVLAFAEPGNVEEFLFYSMREVFLYGVLAYIAVAYLGARDEVKRMRMRRYGKLYGALWILVTFVLLENVCILLVFGPHVVAAGALPFFPERNFAENLLVLCCAFVACRGSWKSLSLRHVDPPTQGGESLEGFIDQNLAAYCAARRLSKREEEVLRLVLLGKDNQNIAASLHLAPGTVKVHVHHILRKAEQGNRKELIQDFWKYA